MIIFTDRHTPEDLEHWNRVEEPRDAATYARLRARLKAKVDEALDVMRAFIAAGDGYLGVSWGKDSIVCAWMLAQLEEREGLRYPAVWVRVRHWENPDCHLVRDRFFDRFRLSTYDEIEVDAGDRSGGTSALGFAEAARRFGDRHISGVRAEESVIRRKSIGYHGISTRRVSRPIGKWRTTEVFALIHGEDLPLHPAYGYTMGGLLDRMRLRTASIGGERGTVVGRREWEERYYPDVFAEAEKEIEGHG